MKTRTLQFFLTRAEADDDQRTVPATISTKNPVQRGDFAEVLSHAPGAIDLSRAPLPLIEGHDSSKTNIGLVENLHLDGGKLRGLVRFGNSARAKELYNDVKTGIVRGLSVGYTWLDHQDRGDVVNVTKWQPFEVSIVAMPADMNAGFFRNLNTMNTAITEPDDIDDIDNAEPEPLTPAHKRAIALGEKKERKRQTYIRDFCRKASLADQVADDLIERGVSEEAAQHHMIQLWSERTDSQTSRGDISRDYGASRWHEAMTDGLLLRAGIRVKNAHPAARDFAGMSLVETTRTLLRNNGQSDLGSVNDIMKRAMSSSDLPHLLETTANKALMIGFEDSAQTHDAFAHFVQVPDFRTQSRVALSAFESLAETPELGEVSFSNVTDLKEQYNIATYQRAIRLSRQMLVNDDLSALTELPVKLGAAARRTEADLVYAIFNGNPNMADSVALFDDTRGNLLTGGTSALGETSLTNALIALRKAKDFSGRGYLGLKPRWLLVPPELEVKALQLLASLVNTQANANAIPNSDFAQISVIVEPRLNSASAWFLLAGGIETIEVGRLSGSDGNGISFESDKDFATDAYSMKVRLDAGVKALSPLGMIKAAGA